MKPFTALIYFCLGLCSGAMAFAAEKADKLAVNPPQITVMVLYDGVGVPAGWADSTTRPDATDMCNQLIATQSKEYATPVSSSRCIIQVQE